MRSLKIRLTLRRGLVAAAAVMAVLLGVLVVVDPGRRLERAEMALFHTVPQALYTTPPEASSQPDRYRLQDVAVPAEAPDGMVQVPAGWFQFGCNELEDPGCLPAETPAAVQYQGAFHIDRHEVTVGEFAACVEAGSCGEWTHAQYEAEDPLRSVCNAGRAGFERQPMNCVSYWGAEAYCRWVGKALPTESQWERAARGSDGRVYPWGNERLDCSRCAMSTEGAGEMRGDRDGWGCGTGATSEVGTHPAGSSPYGVQDMCGNVWEWTSTWYGLSPDGRLLERLADEDPRVGMRVTKGGGISTNGSRYRISTRDWVYPGLVYDPDVGLIGFRCAL